MQAVKVLALIICLIFVSTSLFSCNFGIDNTHQNNNATHQNTTDDVKNSTENSNSTETPRPNTPAPSDKQKVINLFLTYGEYSDGVYRFRQYSTTGNCDFFYSFSYNPQIDMFNCGVLVATYVQNFTMYDSGSVTFSWDDFEHAYVTGYHELGNIASIEFDFYASNPTSNITFGTYQYSVRSNSFTNLTNQNDINEYAGTCFNCVNQSLTYAQSVLFRYNTQLTLW